LSNDREENLQQRFADLTREVAELRRDREAQDREIERLRGEEQWFRALIERASEMVLVLSGDGRIRYVSPSMTRLLAYEPDDLLGKDAFEYIHPEDRDEIQAAFGRTVDGDDRGQPVELRIRHRSGAWRYHEAIGTNLLDSDLLSGVVVNFRDVHRRKATEEALSNEKERLAVTLRSMRDAVITTDHNGLVALLNRAAEEITGWSQGDALNRPLTEVFQILDPRSREPIPFADILDDAQRSTQSRSRRSVLVDRRGVERLVEGKSAPIRDRGSAVVGLALVFRDVTQYEQMERDLQRAEKLDSLGVLAGGIAHDFNNVLTAVLGNIGIARMHAKPRSRIHQLLAEAESASLQARNLTQQLLTFSKGAAPVRQAASIAELVRETAEFALRGSNTRCEFTFDEDLWSVAIDEGQMHQVIQNLVINADQSMPKGGAIDIEATNVLIDRHGATPLDPGRYVRMVIRDRGTGIPEDILASVFDPFFTTKKRGSGLGLAVCYSIVRNHEGHITIDSTAGEGTTVTIHLAAVDDKPSLRALEETIATISDDSRVLVMDDEDLVLTTADMMLRHLGYDTQLTHDGSEAVEAYRRALAAGQPFDAVIVDLTVPGGMGGKDAVSRLLEIDPDARVVVSSGYSTDPVMAEYVAHGFKAVVTKPYKVGELDRALKEALADDDAVD